MLHVRHMLAAFLLSGCNQVGSGGPAEPARHELFGCSMYAPGGGPLRLLDGCARLHADGTIQVAPAALGQLHFEEGLARVYVGQAHRWFHVGPDGAGLSCFEEGFDCAPFREGLTSGVVDGKAVFYGPDLQLAFATDFDWAGGFHDGLAPVCHGVPTSPSGGGDCDHGAPVGGVCGYIDRTGAVVVEPAVALEALRRPDEAAL